MAHTDTLSTAPRAVMAALPATVHLIDAASIAPGVCRITVSPGHARRAAAALLQAGYDVARSGDQWVTVTAPA